MGRRSDLLSAIVTKIGTLLPGVSVGVFEGDERVFNLDSSYPSVWVEYAGVRTGANETVGAVHQSRTYTFSVYFAYDDQADCLAALEAVEDGLPGELGTTGRLLEVSDVPEALLGTGHGTMLYEQVYQVQWDA